MEFGDFPLDPDMRAALERDAAFLAERNYEVASEAEKLAISEALSLSWNTDRPPVEPVRSETIRVAGRPVELRTYQPGDDTGDGYVIWVHGGGWNEGSLDIYDRLMRVLANASACPVTGIGYTRVPKARYPAQIGELVHACRHIAERIFPERRHRFIGGYSAGANLILSSMLVHEDTLGAGYFSGACLACGVFDYDLSSHSHLLYDGYFDSSATRLNGIIEDYAPGAIARRDPIVFPVNGSPALCDRFLVIAAEHDMLRDDSMRLAAHLKKIGKDVTTRCVPSVSHIFLQRSMGVEAGQRTIVETGAYFAGLCRSGAVD